MFWTQDLLLPGYKAPSAKMVDALPVVSVLGPPWEAPLVDDLHQLAVDLQLFAKDPPLRHLHSSGEWHP